MIVQSAPEGEPQFVILMKEHMAFAGQLARAFGNHTFERLDPWEETLFVVEHHDEGWTDWDENPRMDPETRLPCHLLETPRDEVLKTSYGSPDFNERHHAYCGLLSSMHIWGLYNERYGMSDQVLISNIPSEYRERWDKMLADQIERQGRLKTALAARPESAAWIEDAHLFQNYKQLQFFDTLSLYFNLSHGGARKETKFLHVPMSEKEDVTVTLSPVDEQTYRVSPFPFSESLLELRLDGRYLDPLAEDVGSRVGDAIRSAPAAHQTIVLAAK